MSTTLPLFWHLSSSSKSERIDSSVKLIGALEQFQSNFTPFPPESSSEDGEEDIDIHLNDGLDGPNAPDVSYSIRRLVRGLASPRESSRLGFAVALTELLARLDTVSASQIISLITQASQTSSSMKGQEERDMLFARLFGITSLTQSGILFRSTPLATSSVSPCTLKDFQITMDMLLTLPTKKSFLREPSYWALILALRALSASEVSWKAEASGWVAEKVFVEDKSWSPEKIGVALAMQEVGIEADWTILLAPTFKNGVILNSGNLSNLAKVLKDADIEEPDATGAKSKNSVAWKPQLHFVWNQILDIYFSSTGTSSLKFKSKPSFTEFFKSVVDDSLFASTSSDGRKLWGFELLRLSLNRVSTSDLPRMFTPNFMRSWVNHLSKPDRYLHKAAKLVASSLPPVITANPSAGFPVLLQLLQTHGHFDRLTRTKTVESLLAAMDVKGVEEYVLHLGELARNPSAIPSSGGEHDPTATRIWVSDQYSMLIRNGAIPKTDAWISNVLNFLLLHGLFGIRKKNEKSKNQWLHILPEPAFSDEARAACRARLLTCLAELTSQITLIKTDVDKTIRSLGVASDGELWVSKVLHEIVALEKDVKHVVRLGLDEEENQNESVFRDRTLELVQRLKTIPKDSKEATKGAELLLVATILYRYLGEEEHDNDDIETCLDSISRLFPISRSSPDKKKKKKKQEPTTEDVTNNGDVTPIGAVIDTLIGYLEKSTAYLRAVANQAFGFMTGLVDKSTVDLILAQLERRDPTRIEESEEDEEMADVTEGEESDAESSEGDSKSHNSDESEDIEDDPELRRKIEEALRVSGVQAATGDSDRESESDTSDEDVMDDDQMMKLDEHLAEIFRSRVKEKGRGELGAQREATHFKNRVLDLVDIFLRKESTSEHAPIFILPLVRVIMGTGLDEKQLSDKVMAMLRSRLGKAKEIPTAVNLSQTQNALQEVHAMARKAHPPNVRETISVCSLYLTRILLSEPINDEQTVVDAYRASLVDFATRKTSPLHSSFIQDFAKRQPRAAWQLRNDIVEQAQKAVNPYRKCQTFQLLQPLFNQLTSIDRGAAEILDFVRIFRQATLTVASEACDDPESFTTAQMKEILKLCLLAFRQTKRTSEKLSDLQDIWDVPALVSLSVKLKDSRFKAATSLHGLCHQLLVALKPDGEETSGVNTKQTRFEDQKKRKAEDSKGADVKHAKRKKAKKDHE